MPRSRKAMSCLPLLCAFTLAGCGSAANDGPTIPSVAFKSGAIGTSIPTTYTCDGKDIAPPLEWGAVPARARELVVLLVSYTRVPSSNSYRVGGVDWAMAGINPQLRRLAAGQLPRGAFVGRAKNGKRQRYSVCPERGASAYYQFELFALPGTVRVPPNFGDYGAFTVFNAARSSPAIAHGVFTASYKRR